METFRIDYVLAIVAWVVGLTGVGLIFIGYKRNKRSYIGYKRNKRSYELYVAGAALLSMGCVCGFAWLNSVEMDAAVKASRVELKIIESYVDNHGFKTFSISDGGLITVKKHTVMFRHPSQEEASYIIADKDVYEWEAAGIGDIVQREKHVKGGNTYYYYQVVLTDTMILKTVSRVEGPNENMLMSIFFENGQAVVIEAKENPSWLTVQKGDTVIQKRVGSKVLFSPKY